MTPQFLRTIPHLRTRTPFQALVTRARSQLTNSVSQYYFNRARPVIQVHPPLITSSDCEGAGEAFTVALPQKGKEIVPNFFKDPKYLTVSSQLHLEAWSADLGDVWALSPTFRAEESDTSRHLAEFYMLEAEFRSTTTLEDVMVEVESLIRSISQSLSDSSIGAELLEYYGDRRHRPADFEPVDLANRWSLVGVFAQQWPRINFAQAVSELTKAHAANPNLFVHQPGADQGLALEHERWIVENLSPGPPIFVTHYPQHLKPFYMLPSLATTNSSKESDLPTVACFDLLFPQGYAEVCGGSLREHRLEYLIQAMRQKGLVKTTALPVAMPRPNEPTTNHSPTDMSLVPTYPHLLSNENLGSLQWYADLRRFGSSPHGGFGVGFDRLLAYLVGVGNVRDVVGFPRYWGSCHC
jgi:asparaginyl-tRNA synthetase